MLHSSSRNTSSEPFIRSPSVLLIASPPAHSDSCTLVCPLMTPGSSEQAFYPLRTRLLPHMLFWHSLGFLGISVASPPTDTRTLFCCMRCLGPPVHSRRRRQNGRNVAGVQARKRSTFQALPVVSGHSGQGDVCLVRLSGLPVLRELCQVNTGTPRLKVYSDIELSSLLGTASLPRTPSWFGTAISWVTQRQHRARDSHIRPKATCIRFCATAVRVRVPSVRSSADHIAHHCRTVSASASL
ncbi:hypothetical protein C8Q77DRAFT_265104 [Trametes polyzona]|nr:hypothetical protein C8Q77DRAFT_265104 [Trametes polyzona]